MHRNYQKSKRIDTSRYKKSIKNSFWSLISISIGLTFTYLAISNPTNNSTNIKKENTQIEEDYSYTTIGGIGKPDLSPPKKKEGNSKLSPPKR